MSSNDRNIENKGNFDKKSTGPEAGSAANTRGENKSVNKEDKDITNMGNDIADNKSPQGSNANRRTTSRGSDSTDKEFRNNQPNDSTSLDQKGYKAPDSNE
jgi:hypothetical protein